MKNVRGTQRSGTSLVVRVVFATAMGACAAPASFAQAAAATPELTRELRHNDELLLTAVHRGDRETWARLTTSDFMYVEEGEVSRHDDFLRGLEEDGQAPLRIANYDVQVIGDTAQVFHQDDLSERPGVESTGKAHFLMTETWQRINGIWLLRIVHTDRVRINPSPVTLTIKGVDELVGTYRSGKDTYVIQRKGDRVIGERTGRPEDDLKAEARDVFFKPDDVYLRKVFQRDAQGHVTGFIDRRENTDRLWTRATP